MEMPDLCSNTGNIAGWLAFLYMAGVAMKLIFTLLERYVTFTSTIKDDEWFRRLSSNWAYQTLSFILDVAVRFKLPKG